MLFPRRPLAASLLAAALLAAGVSTAAEHTVIVNNSTLGFEPSYLTVQAGDTVIWKVVVGTHGIFSEEGGFGTPPIAAPATFDLAFNSIGVFNYECTLHFAHRGVIHVRPAVAADEVAYVIDAWDMERSSDPVTDSAPFAARFTRGQGVYQAGARLPSGAKITGLEIAACNDSAVAGSTSARLFTCPLPQATCTQIAFVATPDPMPTRCAVSHTSLADGPVVDNLNVTYGVRVNAFEEFQSVRIFYRKILSLAPGTATFSDVPTAHVAFRAVEALAASGITQGCGTGQYCPNQTVTRAEMAIFLARALGLFFPN